MDIIFIKTNFWLIFGFSAQFIFFLRFFTQWICSEKAKKSIIPISFWYLSILGAIMILIYAIHIKDPVFIIGQFFAMMIYIRNLSLFKRNG